MAESFPEFDRTRLRVLPLAKRVNDLDLSRILPLEPIPHVDPCLKAVAKQIIAAKQRNACVVMMMGAHVLRSGVQKYLIDLMERNLFSCIALNGGGIIHDFELALIGATTENVAHYIRDGQFGLWQETGQINTVVKAGAAKGMGLGETVGRAIVEGMFPHAHISILAAAHRCKIPATVHVGIGYDIIHEHPNFDGAAFGAASHRDFLRFAKVLESLDGGVVMNFGSAVMAPEVFLKALSMVRNAAAQENRKINAFTTLVCDLKKLPNSYRTEPCKTDPDYYYRPWKTMLVRTVGDGGESYYVQGNHNITVPGLWTAIAENMADG